MFHEYSKILVPVDGSNEARLAFEKPLRSLKEIVLKSLLHILSILEYFKLLLVLKEVSTKKFKDKPKIYSKNIVNMPKNMILMTSILF